MIFWLSFATQTRNLGVVITEADDAISAHRQVIMSGANPGGEVQMIGFELADAPVDEQARLERIEKNRLFSIDELRSLGFDVVKVTS